MTKNYVTDNNDVINGAVLRYWVSLQGLQAK